MGGVGDDREGGAARAGAAQPPTGPRGAKVTLHYLVRHWLTLLVVLLGAFVTVVCHYAVQT